MGCQHKANYFSAHLVMLVIHMALLGTTTKPANALRYMGVSIGHQQHVFDGWEAKTGKKVDVTIKPFASHLAEAEQDMKQNLNLFDVYQIHPAMTSFAEKKWIRELTNDVKDPKFKWTDIVLSVRKWQTEYDGGAWSIPLDTDSYLLYYRRDLIKTPPNTWEEYIEVAKQWHGKDINGDGSPDFGACTITVKAFHQLAYTIAATVLKFKKGSRQGFLFDVSDRDDELMSDLLETEGWAYTMEVMKDIWPYSQGEERLNTDALKDFRDGRCATFISFGGAGTQAVAPGAYVHGKLGVSRAPGSRQVYDRGTKSLVPCDTELCPYFEPGHLNRPSFNTGGVQLVVNGLLSGEELEEALDFCAYATNHVDVRLVGGLNPFRESHFNATWYTEALPIPWDLTDAEMFTGAVRHASDFAHTTAMPPLPTYPIMAANMDRAIMEYIRFGQYNTSTDDLATIMKNCVKRIQEESLAEGFTPEVLEAALRKAVSLPPYVPPKNDAEFPYWVISIIVVFVALAATAAYILLHKALKTMNAPKNPDKPFATLFIGPKNISAFWQRFPDKVPEAQTIFRDHVRKAIKLHKCYEARRVGDYFLVVSSDPARLVNAAIDIKASLSVVLWEDIFAVNSIQNSQLQAGKRSATETRKSGGRNSHVSSTKSPSESSHHSAWGDGVKLMITAGIGFGTGRLVYDEELNHFEYSGTVVEDAAHVADIAQPGQLLVMESVSSVIEENDSEISGSFTPFYQKKLKGSGSIEQLLQLNPKNAIPQTFAVPTEDAEVVDSVMQALEQAAGGLSQKRITVLNVRIVNGFPGRRSPSRDDVTREYRAVYDLVAAEVVANRGHIDHFHGGECLISFNATNPTAGHTFRGGICALGIINALREKGYDHVQCGFDTGVAWVGRMPSASPDDPPHHAIVGSVVHRARAFAVKCSDYPPQENIHCLTSSELREDLSTALFFQYVDVVHPTFAGICSDEKTATAAPPTFGLLSIIGRKETDEGDCDEWIYELQHHDAIDPFAKMNRCFEAVIAGDFEHARQLLEKVQQEEDENEANKLPTSTRGARERIQEMITTGRN